MEKQYLTVTALTRYIKTKIEYDPHLQSVWLKGEISNFKNHSRGHMYFTLKDENARIYVDFGEKKVWFGDVQMGRCTLSHHGMNNECSPFLKKELVATE